MRKLRNIELRRSGSKSLPRGKGFRDRVTWEIKIYVTPPNSRFPSPGEGKGCRPEALLRTHIQKMNNCHFIFSGSDRHILEQMFSSYAKPFYNSAHPVHLGRIDRDKYIDFVIGKFREADIAISPVTAGYCYDAFDGYTYYNHKVFHDIFACVKKGDVIDNDMVDQTIGNILEENSHTYSEVMSGLPSSSMGSLLPIWSSIGTSGLVADKFFECWLKETY